MKRLATDEESTCLPKTKVFPCSKKKSTASQIRFERRLEEAKKKARPELVDYGWETLGYANRYELPDCVDNIERIDASTMSLDEFRLKYEAPRVPVIMTGLTDNWKANTNWTLERLERKLRQQKMKCGEDDDGYSVKLKMKYYARYMQSTRDDSPLYIFDSGYGERNKTRRLLDDYEIPKFFQDDLFRYADEKRRPPYRWFVMGPARSGTAIHIDPLGTSAWNALISGHKRWALLPPGAPKDLVKPSRLEAGKHPDEAVTWFQTVYRRAKSGDWPQEFKMLEAVQNPGEVMFVPSGWWHVVLNVDATIAVTQNFCSLVNLHIVWPKTVRGRPRLSRHWLKRLRYERPDATAIIEKLVGVGFEEGDTSEDSSSSSSSSECSSSSDEGEESTSMMTGKRRRVDVALSNGNGHSNGHNGA